MHHVARRLARALTGDAQFDDLVSAGTVGLMQAVETFDRGRGLAFSTYAAPRIRGAMLDDMRRWDHLPRSIRCKQRQISSARDALRASLDREPDDRETAAELDIEVEKLWRWEAEIHQAQQASEDRPAQTAEARATPPPDQIPAEDADAMESRLDHEQEVDLLREEILKLKERQRVVLSLYYFEELKLHEIAEVLGLTESRVSQIRSQAIAALRAALARLRDPDGSPQR